MYVSRKSRGMGDASTPCLVGSGPLDVGQQYCASVDTVTVSASPGTGPLCFSGFMFPWLGRLDGSSGSLQCVDLATYNGISLPAPVPALITAVVGFLFLRAVTGGGR